MNENHVMKPTKVNLADKFSEFTEHWKPRQHGKTIHKRYLHKGKPSRKTSNRRNQNLRPGGAKQVLFANKVRLIGVSGNPSPRG
jgi:hypothetical protein